MTALMIVVASFAAMEVVSYASHRWLMHGPGMAWHRSHHHPPAGRFEKNDLFPLCFSTLGVAAFAAAALSERLLVVPLDRPGDDALRRHVPLRARDRHPPPCAVRIPARGYAKWLSDSHRIHHLFGGEPYGMLMPFVPRSLRERAGSATRAPLDRSTPVTRIRL